MNYTNVVYPCRNCIYFEACGSNSRVVPCKGRVAEKQKKSKGNNK